MKTCNKCKEEKDEIDFYKSSCSKDGLQSCCRMCWKIHYSDTRDTETIKKYYKTKCLKQFNSKPSVIDPAVKLARTINSKLNRQAKIEKWNLIFKKIQGIDNDE